MGKTRVVFIDPGAKVYSSYYCNIVLEKGLLPDIRAILLYVVNTGGQYSRMKHQRAPPDHDGLGLSEKREHQLY